MLFKHFYGIGVGHSAEIRRSNRRQSFNQSLVHKLIQKRNILLAVFQNIVDDKLNHRLGKLHVVLKVGKSNFRLNHPELGGMTLGVGFFGAEGRSEGVNLSESLCHDFALKLTGHGKKSRLSEKVLGIINRSVLFFRRIFHVERRNTEHFAGAFTVTAGNQRCVRIYETVLCKESMDCISRGGAYPESGGIDVRSRTKMRNCSQILERMALFLKRIIGSRSTLNGNFACVDFKRLLCLRCQNKTALDDNRRTGVQLCGVLILFVAELFPLKNDLNAFKTAAVVKLDKA